MYLCTDVYRFWNNNKTVVNSIRKGSIIIIGYYFFNKVNHNQQINTPWILYNKKELKLYFKHVL